jgi:hypothetical protein
MRNRPRGTDGSTSSSAPGRPIDHDMQVRLARINAASGLVGALLGATVALVVALTQLSAQNAQIGKQVEQDQARFLRDNRLVAYTDALDAYAQLNSHLAGMARAGSLDAQLQVANELREQAGMARRVSTRTQLLGTPEIQTATRELNKAYLDYLTVVIKDVGALHRNGADLTAPPPEPSAAQKLAINAKGVRYNEWLLLVRKSIAADDP